MANRVPTVLIVDDEHITCDLLCEVLGEKGYACQAVNSGDEALARLKENEFDLALLDIRMPGLSGMDLLVTMGESYRKTSVVMTTAVSDTNTAVEAMKRGALDYILKPFSTEEVIARVGKVLRDKAMRGDSVAETAKSDKQGASPAQVQMDAIARGVEARVSQFDFHSTIVIEKTLEVARQLGLPEKEIEKWAAAQRELGLAEKRRFEWATGEFSTRP